MHLGFTGKANKAITTRQTGLRIGDDLGTSDRAVQRRKLLLQHVVIDFRWQVTNKDRVLGTSVFGSTPNINK
jgi:hypothetical protein